MDALKGNPVTIPINPTIIKALTHIAPKADVRYYLTGVLVDVMTRETRYVATCGALLVAVREVIDDDEPARTPAQIIIPHAAAAALKPCKHITHSALTYSTEPGAECRIDPTSTGAVVFVPIDGKFPSYARVFPMVAPSLAHAHFDARLVWAAERFAQDACGKGKLGLSHILPNGPTDRACVVFSGLDAFGILMPRRADVDVDSIPAWAQPAGGFPAPAVAS